MSSFLINDAQDLKNQFCIRAILKHQNYFLITIFQTQAVKKAINQILLLNILWPDYSIVFAQIKNWNYLIMDILKLFCIYGKCLKTVDITCMFSERYPHLPVINKQKF